MNTNTPTLATLGHVLRTRMRAQHITPADLAWRLRTNGHQVNRWLLGIDELTVGVLCDIAATLGTTPSELLQEVETFYPCSCDDNRCAGTHHPVGAVCGCGVDPTVWDAVHVRAGAPAPVVVISSREIRA